MSTLVRGLKPHRFARSSGTLNISVAYSLGRVLVDCCLSRIVSSAPLGSEYRQEFLDYVKAYSPLHGMFSRAPSLDARHMHTASPLARHVANFTSGLLALYAQASKATRLNVALACASKGVLQSSKSSRPALFGACTAAAAIPPWTRGLRRWTATFESHAPSSVACRDDLAHISVRPVHACEHRCKQFQSASPLFHPRLRPQLAKHEVSPSSCPTTGHCHCSVMQHSQRLQHRPGMCCCRLRDGQGKQLLRVLR